MKWYTCLGFIFWMFGILFAENRTQYISEPEDGWKIIVSDPGSNEDFNPTTVPSVTEPEEIEEITTPVIMPNESEEEPFFRFFKENLDVLNPRKIESFLTENLQNISLTCGQNLMEYLKGLKQGQLWAMKSKSENPSLVFTVFLDSDLAKGKALSYSVLRGNVEVLDASGSYSYSFLFGNDYWLGSQTACLDFLHSSNAKDSPPFPLAYNVAKYHVPLNFTIQRPVRPILFGVCLPLECSNDDIKLMLQNLSTPFVELKNIRKVPNSNYKFYLEPIAVTLAVITSVSVILVIIGTWYDYQNERKHQEKSSQGQRNKEIGQSKNSIKVSTVDKLKFYVNHHTEGNHRGSELGLTDSNNSINSSASSGSVSSFSTSENKIGTVQQVILCFSFKRNFGKICNVTTTDSLACVHGLRVLSLLWVIAGHTCMITMPFVDNKSFRTIVERDFLFQSISNGAFSVDTFFFISGLLISYVFYKSEIEKNVGKKESAKVHAKNSMLKFFGGVSYRLIRLSPPYIVVLILTYLTGRWFYFNSVFDTPVADHFTCPTYWWRNLLYINTLFPVEQMCMIWSWYLADDTQFYFLGLILLLISSRYAKTALTLTGFFMITSLVTTAVITLYTQHKPSIEEPLGLFDQLYDKPWTRLGPYIVGMAVGVYLAKINCKATYHKGVVAFFWIASMVTTFVLVHGLYSELGQVESAAYVSLSHTAWALAISWIIVSCVTGYGGPVNSILSLKVFAPLSRLSYCAYLIHPLIMLSTMAHMDGPIHLQRDTMIIAIFGYFFTAYLGSIVLTLVYEAPAVALLNKFHPLKKKVK